MDENDGKEEKSSQDPSQIEGGDVAMRRFQEG